MANLTGTRIQTTYNHVVQIDPQSTGSRGNLQDGLGNPIDANVKSLAISQSLIVTGSTTLGSDLTVEGDGSIIGDLVVGGTVTAQEFISEYVSSSVIYESGSTDFGDSLNDLHQRTGSWSHTGSFNTTGTLSINSTGNITQVGDYTQTGSTIRSGSTTLTGSLSHSGSAVTEGTYEVKEGVYGAFFANPQTINENVTIPASYNSRLFGPITVAAGKTLTVGANAKLEITDI
jgi:hypothetical protein